MADELREPEREVEQEIRRDEERLRQDEVRLEQDVKKLEAMEHGLGRQRVGSGCWRRSRDWAGSVG